MEPNGSPLLISRKCGLCGQHLEIREPLYLVEVVRPYHDAHNEQKYHRPLTPDGDFVNSPYYFHESCWDDVLLRLEEALDGHNHLPDKDVRSTYTCRGCGEGIREEELACLETAGHMRLSGRYPNHNPTTSFEEVEEPCLLCVACATIINTTFSEFEETPLWTDLQEEHECRSCTYMRCWRDPSCDCECHQ